MTQNQPYLVPDGVACDSEGTFAPYTSHPSPLPREFPTLRTVPPCAYAPVLGRATGGGGGSGLPGPPTKKKNQTDLGPKLVVFSPLYLLGLKKERGHIMAGVGPFWSIWTLQLHVLCPVVGPLHPQNGQISAKKMSNFFFRHLILDPLSW